MNRWLRAVLLDMLQRYSDGTTEALESAITTLTGLIEPAMLEEQFAPWVVAYYDLLEEYQKQVDSLQHPSALADSEEFVGLSGSIDKPRHRDTEV